MKYSWTQPCCDACCPHPDPVHLRDPDRETCVYCGRTTWSGIYVRIDPRQAAYPSLLKERA